jgi:hypothetical protein
MEISNQNHFHGVLKNNVHLARIRYFFILIVLFLLGGSLSGCITMADPEASQDYTADTIGTLDAKTDIGQSFISRRPNLNGITVWLTRLPNSTDAASVGNLNNLEVKLFKAPADSDPIFSATVIIPPSGNRTPISISIPNQDNPSGQAYFLQLANATGTIQVNGRNEDAYPFGQAYSNNQPFDADIAFRMTYDYGISAFIGDIAGSLSSTWLIFPLLAVLWLPGWLLLEFSGLRQHYDYGEQVGLAIGFSLSLIPLLMLWTTTMKLKWTTKSVAIAAGILAAVFIARLIFNSISVKKSRYKSPPGTTSGSLLGEKQSRRFSSLTSVALVLVFLGTLTARLIMIRDLATPAWVDSIHHALITSLIIDKGAFPSTYLPFLDISSSAYHAGFHSIAATFTWLSQLDLVRSLLILGQVLNALTVFSVYLLAKTFTHNSTAGLFAAIITGFVTPMPAYYTSWGRYTELTGLLVLPVIIVLIQSWIDGVGKPKKTWIIILGAISAGGLFMIHYRVLAFMACLVISFLIFHSIYNRSVKRNSPAQLLFVVIAMAVLGIAIVLPWFIQTVQTSLLPYINNASANTVPLFRDFTWSYLTSALGMQALVLAGLGLLWGILKLQRLPFIMIVWVIFLFLIANLAAFKLPGAGLVNNSSVEIMLFLPISILGGYFAGELLAQWRQLIPDGLVFPSVGVLIILISIVAYFGAKQLIPIINPITILSRSADLKAMQWISENIPADETVVINPFAWGYGLYAGNDGGYWISPLSGRQSLPPALIYSLSPEVAEINSLSQQVISLAPDPAAFRRFMQSHQLDYIYLGARGGVISPQRLISSNLFTVLYHQDGVWVMAAKP